MRLPRNLVGARSVIGGASEHVMPRKYEIADILRVLGTNGIDGLFRTTNRLWSPPVATTAGSGQQPVNKF